MDEDLWWKTCGGRFMVGVRLVVEDLWWKTCGGRLVVEDL